MRYTNSLILFFGLLVAIIGHNFGVEALNENQDTNFELSGSQLEALLDADAGSAVHENQAAREARQFFPGFGGGFRRPFFGGGGFERPYYGGGFGRPFGGFGGGFRRRGFFG